VNQSDKANALQAFYDADAQGYFEHRWNRNVVTRADYAITRDILMSQLAPAPGARLLEIGCGPGTWTEVVISRGAVVTALDISEGMLSEARRRVEAGRARFIRADFATWLPEEGELFDGAYSVRVFEHIAEKREALRRLRALLRPGARAVIITKTVPSVWNGRVRIMRTLRGPSGKKGLTGVGSERFWMERAAPWKLARLMNDAGFIKVGVTPVVFRPPFFRGGESEYPLISDEAAPGLLRLHHRMSLGVLKLPGWMRVAKTLGSESYAAWGVVPGGAAS
jgi:ubiquinone/menaquinone biosynthesis C-methylase UbiE